MRGRSASGPMRRNAPVLLIFGALCALLWANVDPGAYRAFVDFALFENAWIGHLHLGAAGAPHRTLTAGYMINDALMSLFFASAGKKVWEALALRNGALRGSKAVTPLIAAPGGMTGPILVYLGVATAFGSTACDAVANGWAIPTATDIAFSYLVGRMVFGAGHPAVRFLLLLAIAGDAAGLAIFYPTVDVSPAWLLVAGGAVAAVYLAANRLARSLDAGRRNNPTSAMARRRFAVWPCALAGAPSWYAVARSGSHPAPGLLPVVMTLAHADIDHGDLIGPEDNLHDLLTTAAQALRRKVEGILFLFGLANAGVELGALGPATWLVLSGLLVDKPLGIFAFGWIVARPLGFGLPQGMATRDLFVLGCVAAIGCAVSLFVASVAFAPGPVQDAAEMGALFSVAAALISLAAGRLCGIVKVTG